MRSFIARKRYHICFLWTKIRRFADEYLIGLQEKGLGWVIVGGGTRYLPEEVAGVREARESVG